jgi:hypothetical protein|tara:strand:- start:24 stop:269 length:246 start_codon:yes stop_codon:yes gene_type:complete
MKNLLTEKNLMWAAIAVLAVLHLCPALGIGEPKGRHDAMRQRMGHMQERMGSRGDMGKGAWIKEKKDGVREGRKKAPKDTK